MSRGHASVAREPSSLELVLLTVCSCAVIAIVIQIGDPTRGFWDFGAGDTPSYAVISQAVREGHLSGLADVRLFWGVSYAAAIVALLTHVSDLTALLIVSFATSLIATLLIKRLWGGWVAAFFVVLSWDWLVASTLGGSEPLFMTLLCASFVAARRQRWIASALAASCSMVVRPIGSFALAAATSMLLRRREWRRAVAAMAIGTAVAAAYAVPLVNARGTVLAHVLGYEGDWPAGRPLAMPFSALRQGVRAMKRPIQVVRPAVAVCFILASVVVFAARRATRAYAGRYPQEVLFASAYVLFLFTYNSVPWAWLEFPRFVIPLLPFALTACEPWLPRRRPLVWVLAPTSGFLAAAWLLGFHQVWTAVRGLV